LTKYKYSPKVGENGFVTINIDIVFIIFIVFVGKLNLFSPLSPHFLPVAGMHFPQLYNFTILASFSDIQELIP